MTSLDNWSFVCLCMILITAFVLSVTIVLICGELVSEKLLSKQARKATREKDMVLDKWMSTIEETLEIVLKHALFVDNLPCGKCDACVYNKNMTDQAIVSNTNIPTCVEEGKSTSGTTKLENQMNKLKETQDETH